MLAAVVPAADGWRLRLVADGTSADGVDRTVSAEQLRAVETAEHPRWIWADAATDYRSLVAAGLTVDRCHDLGLTERILLSRADRYGQPSTVSAVLARRRGEQVEAPLAATAAAAAVEPTLFDPEPTTAAPAGPGPADLLLAFSDQQQRSATAVASPAGESVDVAAGALRLLIAAESASGLAAAEMGGVGLPWDAAEHDRILTRLLGPRPAAGRRPSVLAGIAERIDAAFGRPVNPDSAVELREAFRRAGFDVANTRSAVLRKVDHPAVEPVLAYKELSRLHTANGWNWLDQWVCDGRFRAEYHAGAVISGRWATSGGGALQIPRVLRAAVRAEAGFRLVVADAAQLEPRVLIAVSGDRELGLLAAGEDLYTALATVGFAGDRGQAKLALLGAMYGATSGQAGQLLGTLRARFPVAMAFVEDAARRGERGRLVGSVLGRVSHRPNAAWLAGGEMEPDGAEVSAQQERRAREASRAWGRFTRNFVVQASAADWAAVWLSFVRMRLRADVPAAELVLFQHDELVVHAPAEAAERVAVIVVDAARQADAAVFPAAPAGWRVPVRPAVVGVYSDAK